MAENSPGNEINSTAGRKEEAAYENRGRLV